MNEVLKVLAVWSMREDLWQSVVALAAIAGAIDLLFHYATRIINAADEFANAKPCKRLRRLMRNRFCR